MTPYILHIKKKINKIKYIQPQNAIGITIDKKKKEKKGAPTGATRGVPPARLHRLAVSIMWIWRGF